MNGRPVWLASISRKSPITGGRLATGLWSRSTMDDAIATLPAWFHDAPAIDLAGGPVEIIWQNVEGRLSVQPCHDPERIPLDPTNPLLWFPADCGECPPCQARAAI